MAAADLALQLAIAGREPDCERHSTVEPALAERVPNGFTRVEVDGDGLCYIAAPMIGQNKTVPSRLEVDSFLRLVIQFIKDNENTLVPCNGMTYKEHIDLCLKSNKVKVTWPSPKWVTMVLRTYLKKLMARGDNGEVCVVGDYDLLGWSICSVANLNLVVHNQQGEIVSKFGPIIATDAAATVSVHVIHTGGTRLNPNPNHYDVLEPVPPSTTVVPSVDTTLADDTTLTDDTTMANAAHFQCCYNGCNNPVGGEEKLGNSCNMCVRGKHPDGSIVKNFEVALFCPTHFGHHHHKMGRYSPIRPPCQVVTGAADSTQQPDEVPQKQLTRTRNGGTRSAGL